MRNDGRQPNQLRNIEITRGFTTSAPGSVLIRTGGTHVLCTACISESVPEWREKSGHGWLTAEYDMLPGATGQRRERNRTKVDGRTREIERLIGRSLRMAVDLKRLGPRTIHLDCDVLQADGGTRTASVTGAYVALADALAVGRERGFWGLDAGGFVPAGATADTGKMPVPQVAAVSVGIVGGAVLLDLDYSEDVRAEVDCNLVMTDRDEWIEVQATGERAMYSDAQLRAMLDLGRAGIRQLFDLQRAALK